MNKNAIIIVKICSMFKICRHYTKHFPCLFYSNLILKTTPWDMGTLISSIDKEEMKTQRFRVIEPLCTVVWIAYYTWAPSNVSGWVWVKNGSSPSLGFHLPRGTPVSNLPKGHKGQSFRLLHAQVYAVFKWLIRIWTQDSPSKNSAILLKQIPRVLLNRFLCSRGNFCTRLVCFFMNSGFLPEN